MDFEKSKKTILSLRIMIRSSDFRVPTGSCAWHADTPMYLFTSTAAPCAMAGMRTAMESAGLARTKYLLRGPRRNSVLIPAQSRWQVPGILDGVFKVDSVYDLMWLHLQTSYIIYIIAFEYHHLLGK